MNAHWGTKGIILLPKLPNMIRNHLSGLLSCSFEVGVFLIVDVGLLLREFSFFKVKHDNVTTINILKKTNFLSFPYIFVDNIFCCQTSFVVSYFCFVQMLSVVPLFSFMCACVQIWWLYKVLYHIYQYISKKKFKKKFNKRIFENKTSSVRVKVKLFFYGINWKKSGWCVLHSTVIFSGNTFCGKFRLTYFLFFTRISKN